MNKDDQELNEILKDSEKMTPLANNDDLIDEPLEQISDGRSKSEGEVIRGKQIQWTTGDGRIFVPASYTQDCLTPGVYEIKQCPNIGLYFEKIPVKTEGLIRFPQANSEKVINEIQTFWNKGDVFKEYGLNHKRGIILWGPPGSGKSCTIQFIMKDVVERGGIVIKFDHPRLFMEGMRAFREIQRNTPAVILLEDIDSTLEIFNESEVLNILDGVNEADKVVFLATTNYPDRLGHRIINRPSRFDKRFKIDHPDEQSREIYFKFLIGENKIKELDIDIRKWVADTEDFSIAHLKELFVAVVILGDDYEEAIETLDSMKEQIKSNEYESNQPMGFNTRKRRR